jgi:hypothetical protein
MRNRFPIKNGFHWTLLIVPLTLYISHSFVVCTGANGVPNVNDSIVKEHMDKKASWIAEEYTLRQGLSVGGF